MLKYANAEKTFERRYSTPKFKSITPTPSSKKYSSRKPKLNTSLVVKGGSSAAPENIIWAVVAFITAYKFHSLGIRLLNQFGKNLLKQ